MNTLTIPAFSAEAAEAAQRRLDNLAKVPRSLGRIEELAVRLAGITGKECPAFPEKSVVLFAADHDIALQGVSATGQEVTEMQVRNFVKGGGTINAFCRNAGARLSVVDIGVKNDLDDVEGLVRRKVMHAARDFSEGPAMTREEALACVQVGIDMAREEAARGVTLLAAGEMGIGNTSPSSAIAAVLTGASVDEVTGIGSGIPSERVRHKAGLIRRGIAINLPNPSDAVDVLAKVGGPELAAMSGLMLGGASLRIPVVVDGFIAGAAAAIAIGIRPGVRDMLIGSHSSVEPGHQILMDYLGIPTYFDFGLRLGEGTGAALLYPIIHAAVPHPYGNEHAARHRHEMMLRAALGFFTRLPIGSAPLAAHVPGRRRLVARGRAHHRRARIPRARPCGTAPARLPVRRHRLALSGSP